MAIEHAVSGFFNVPHLLWHGASVCNVQFRGPVTLTHVAKRLAVELSVQDLFLRLGSVAAGIRTRSELPHMRRTFLPTAPSPRPVTGKHKTIGSMRNVPSKKALPAQIANTFIPSTKGDNIDYGTCMYLLPPSFWIRRFQEVVKVYEYANKWLLTGSRTHCMVPLGYLTASCILAGFVSQVKFKFLMMYMYITGIIRLEIRQTCWKTS